MKKYVKCLFLLAGFFALPLMACEPGPEDVSSIINKAAVKSVTIEPEAATLDVGETITLTPHIEYIDDGSYDIPLRWNTSDPQVASVDNGFVTAVGSGSATISVIAGYKMGYCQITVRGEDVPPSSSSIPVPPDSSIDSSGAFTITLNSRSEEIAVGDTFQLVATTSEPATVTWTSSDPDVASVVNGLVTGLEEGDAVITASANGVSATCEISVVDEISDPYNCDVFFFIDYNNIDPDDTTGVKRIAHFRWYNDQPLSASGQVPSDPTVAMDPAFPYFIGWSSHTIIDSKNDLWDMEHDVVGNAYYIYLYGIWADVPKGEFNL